MTESIHNASRRGDIAMPHRLPLEAPPLGDVDTRVATEASEQMNLFEMDAPSNEVTFREGKQRWQKYCVAVILGMAGGFSIKILLAIPLFLILHDSAPDTRLILELISSFFAGSIAGCLVLRNGWFFGMLTQTFKIVLTLSVISVWSYTVASNPEVGLSFDLIRNPEMRIILLAIIMSAIAGAVAQAYREKIWAFLAQAFGTIVSGGVFLIHALGALVYFYLLYIAGYALFAEGRVLKALLIVVVIGPLLSYGGSFLLFGVFMAGYWVFRKVFNWYAEDLGMEPVE